MGDSYDDSPAQAREAGLRRLSRLTWRSTQIGALATVGFAIVFARTAPAQTASNQTTAPGTPAPAAHAPAHTTTRAGLKPKKASSAPGATQAAAGRSSPSTAPVLDGIVLAATAVGAAEAYLCVHDHETELMSWLNAAVAERDDPAPIR